MFVHSVYFWLRDSLTPAEDQRFTDGVESLLGIKGIVHGYIGVPAPTDRPVIDRSYSRALVLVFADEAAHDAYQVHPVHDRFRTECGGLWKTVRIYDSVSDKR
jgi:hypothetical protein